MARHQTAPIDGPSRFANGRTDAAITLIGKGLARPEGSERAVQTLRVYGVDELVRALRVA
jgi:hypothetical protein